MKLSGLNQFLEELTSAGIDIKRGGLGENHFTNSIRKPYLSSLVLNLERRFEDKSVMAAFDIFNPAKLTCLPSEEDLTTFLRYGNKEVEDLAKQCGVVPNIQECVKEWSSFRQYLKDNCSHLKHLK